LARRGLAPRTCGRKGRPQPLTPPNRRSHPPAAESYVPPASRVSLTPPPLLSRSHVRSCRRSQLTSRTSLLQRGAARCVRRARLRPPAAATAEPPLAPLARDGRRHHALNVPSPHPRPALPLQVHDSWPAAGPRKCRAAAARGPPSTPRPREPRAPLIPPSLPPPQSRAAHRSISPSPTPSRSRADKC
jgi:hypothetical protein